MAIEMMLTQMARNWGWIVLRGVAAILFGILSFAWPGLTLAVLVIVWGAYALADGLFALMAGIRLKMWPLTIVGLLGICAGIFTFLRPGITALVLLGLIAVWALATGIFQVAAAIHFRKMISNEWMLILSGVLSIAFGAAMLARLVRNAQRGDAGGPRVPAPRARGPHGAEAGVSGGGPTGA
jgi:uncharacterized membrane protein HdeD (DUF308 family)